MSSIVIVPGLGSHAFGLFTGKGTDYMWPQDALPKVLANKGVGARIVLYGYNATLMDKKSTQNIDTISQRLSERLKALPGADDAAPKPIVFIGHGMGGLVIKRVRSPLAIKRRYLTGSLGHQVFGGELDRAVAASVRGLSWLRLLWRPTPRHGHEEDQKDRWPWF